MTGVHDSKCIPSLRFLSILKERREAKKTSGEERTPTEQTKYGDVKLGVDTETVLASIEDISEHVSADEPPSYLLVAKLNEPLPQDLIKHIDNRVDEIAPELKKISLRIHGMLREIV